MLTQVKRTITPDSACFLRVFYIAIDLLFEIIYLLVSFFVIHGFHERNKSLNDLNFLNKKYIFVFITRVSRKY